MVLRVGVGRRTVGNQKNGLPLQEEFTARRCGNKVGWNLARTNVRWLQIYSKIISLVNKNVRRGLRYSTSIHNSTSEAATDCAKLFSAIMVTLYCWRFRPAALGGFSRQRERDRSVLTATHDVHNKKFYIIIIRRAFCIEIDSSVHFTLAYVAWCVMCAI